MKKLLLLSFSLFCFLGYVNATSKISQEQAWEILKKSVFSNNPENVNVFICKSAMFANSHIKTYGDDEITPNSSSWMFFVDDIPMGNWCHPCRYIYVDCETGELTSHNHSMPPIGIKMKPLVEQRVNSKTLLYDGREMRKLLRKSMTADCPLNRNTASNEYAVIINGGIDSTMNYIRYWNDCAAIYSTLVNVYGYNRNNIYVLMSDGTNPAKDRNTYFGYDSSPLDLDGDGTNDIQYAATRTNVISVLNSLSSTLTADDDLFIYTMDHGGRQNNNSYLCLWNNEKIFDFEFASYLANIHAKSINICMGQCYSGGFIDDLSNSKYVIATACKSNEFSYALDYWYDAFVYYWTAAVAGAYPNGTSANADTNNDGYISMREAFDFASYMDNANETPQYSSSPLTFGNFLCLSYPELQISGDTVLCDTETYVVAGIPSGYTINWTIDNNNFTITPSGNQCTVSYIGSQQYSLANLTANICYGGYLIEQITKSIISGTSELGDLVFSNYYGEGNWIEGNVGNVVAVESGYNPYYNQYECNIYRINNLFQEVLVRHAFNNTPSFEMSTAYEGWYTVYIRGINGCGYSEWSSGEIETVAPQNNGPEDRGEDQCLIIYNPDDNSLTVKWNEETTQGTYDVQVWNSTKLVRSVSSNMQETKLSLAGLPKGFYIAKVIRNGKIYAKKFAIKN
jgi:hypothetical protein